MAEYYIRINGLDRAAVLAALVNASRPTCECRSHFEPGSMSIEDARRHVSGRYIEAGSLRGRYLRIRLVRDLDHFWSEHYDKVNGEGAAQKVIDSLRATGDVNNPVIRQMHEDGMKLPNTAATH